MSHKTQTVLCAISATLYVVRGEKLLGSLKGLLWHLTSLPSGAEYFNFARLPAPATIGDALEREKAKERASASASLLDIAPHPILSLSFFLSLSSSQTQTRQTHKQTVRIRSQAKFDFAFFPSPEQERRGHEARTVLILI